MCDSSPNFRLGEVLTHLMDFFFIFSKTILGNQKVKVQSKKEAIAVFLALTATPTFSVKEVMTLENVQILNFRLYFGNLLWKNRFKVQSKKQAVENVTCSSDLPLIYVEKPYWSNKNPI